MYDPEIYDHHCSMIIWSLSFIRSEQQSAIVGIVTSWTMTSCKYANNIKKNNNNNNKQINNWQCTKFLFQMWLYNCLFVVCCHKTVLYIIYKIMSHHQTRYDSYVFLPRIYTFGCDSPKKHFVQNFWVSSFFLEIFCVGCVCRRIYKSGKPPIRSTIEGASTQIEFKGG